MSVKMHELRRRLLGVGQPVAVGRRAFDLLVVLVDRAGQPVTKDELLERVWPKLVVEENSLRVRVSAVRAKRRLSVRSGRASLYNVSTLTPAGLLSRRECVERAATKQELSYDHDPPER